VFHVLYNRDVLHNTTGTCSLASAKKIHEHNGVDPSESPDVIMYHSPERCV